MPRKPDRIQHTFKSRRHLAKKLAADKAGICLAKRISSVAERIKWRCAKGHTWYTSLLKVQQGQWCAKRSGYGPTDLEQRIDRANEVLAKYGGELISREILRMKDRLVWICRCGHPFEKSLEKVWGGKEWCPECARDRVSRKLRTPFLELTKLALKRGGRILSKPSEYRNQSSTLKWQCSMGHSWLARVGNVKSGTWCPQCGKNPKITEEICRLYFEQLSGLKFPPAAPKWLKSPRGTQLYLDGYNENVELAFEHDGTQHFIETRFYDRYKLSQRKKDDLWREKQCRKMGVTLIRIRELLNKTSLLQLQTIVTKALRQKKIEVLAKEPDIHTAYRINPINELQEIAKVKGGKLLSPRYLGGRVKLTFLCSNEHTFHITPNSLRQGKWCKACVRNTYTVEKLQSLAKDRGGRFLGKSYKNLYQKHKWECSKGHRWEASLASTLKHWCRKCSTQKNAEKRRLGIEAMQNLAKKRGGACLSAHYVNTQTNLKWRCECGNIWWASPSNIKAGKWCPECGKRKSANKQRGSIKDMQALAQKRGGTCISKKYLDSKTHLKWRCSKGHQWLARPYNIKSGKWCPECAKEQRVKTRSRRHKK